MKNHVSHFFPANQLHVITGVMPNGWYGAYRHETDQGRIRGIGPTPIDAIIDMVASIAEEGDEL